MGNGDLLLIDDDGELAALLTRFVRRYGYSLRWADRPTAAYLALEQELPDLILLDVMLPEQDGFEVCRQLRARGVEVPIIMLTARGAPGDRIAGLRLGADDYLPKPFEPDELVARIEAVLRRVPAVFVPSHGPTLDDAARSLTLGGRTVPLTPAEFRIMARLLASPGTICTRAQLLDALDEAGAGESYEHAIDTHINRLRQKLEADPRHPRYILTAWGIGYRFHV